MARRSRYVAYMHQMQTAGDKPAVSAGKKEANTHVILSEAKNLSKGSVRTKIKQMKEKTTTKKEGN